MKGTIIVKAAHCINWKNKSFFCLIDLIRKNQTIKVDLICMVRCLKKNCIFYYWLQMTWILELSGQQRIIILENLNWLTQLGTNLNPILHYPNIYTEWKIGLIQYCAKFEQVLQRTWDIFVDFKHLSASFKWIFFMYNVLHYTTVRSLFRKNLFKKNLFKNTSQLCRSKAVSLRQNTTTFTAKI